MRRLPSLLKARDKMRSALPAKRWRMALPSALCSSTSRLPDTAIVDPSGEKRSAVITAAANK